MILRSRLEKAPMWSKAVTRCQCRSIKRRARTGPLVFSVRCSTNWATWPESTKPHQQQQVPQAERHQTIDRPTHSGTTQWDSRLPLLQLGNFIPGRRGRAGTSLAL